jgi:hypothetical protein
MKIGGVKNNAHHFAPPRWSAKAEFRFGSSVHLGMLPVPTPYCLSVDIHACMILFVSAPTS